MPIPLGVSGLRDPSLEPSQTGERLAAYLDDARGDLSGNTVRAPESGPGTVHVRGARSGGSGAPRTIVRPRWWPTEAMASARAPATVRRYVSSVAAAHRAAFGEQSPLEDDHRAAVPQAHVPAAGGAGRRRCRG